MQFLYRYAGILLNDALKVRPKFYIGDIVVMARHSGSAVQAKLVMRSSPLAMTVATIRQAHVDEEGRFSYTIVSGIARHLGTRATPGHRSRPTTFEADETDLMLVRRGKLAQFFNGDRIKFKDWRFELEFFVDSGMVDVVNGDYLTGDTWTPLLIQRALEDGLVDGYRVFVYGRGVGSPIYVCYKLHLPSMGDRMRREALTKLNVTGELEANPVSYLDKALELVGVR